MLLAMKLLVFKSIGLHSRYQDCFLVSIIQNIFWNPRKSVLTCQFFGGEVGVPEVAAA